MKNGTKEGGLKDLFSSFLEKGFLFSAKNQFQMIKTYKIAGREFAYNVDFIHPKSDGNSEIFIDHLDIGVPIDKYQSKTFKMMSIATPNALGLFDGYYEMYSFMNNEKIIEFPLMNEIGLLITKSESVKVAKRKRDSLDIFLAIKNCRNYPQMILKLCELKNKNKPLFNSLYGIRAAFDEKILICNVMQYYNDENDINKTFTNFFQDSSLDQCAEN
ncbi:MAG: hypothetical protein WAX77_03400 [Methylococcaceae bacterium]